MITAEEARAHLRYDPRAAVLWWKIPGSGRRMDRPAGTTESAGYRSVYVLGRSYKAHHLIFLIKTGRWPKEIDHKNTKRGDNRWSNLREATRSQNRMNSNRYKNNTSGFKGASWHAQHRKWYATIQINKKPIFLGLFPTAKQAHAAYVKAAKKHFGEYARAR